MNDPSEASWNEYRKLVLSALDRIDKQYENLNSKIEGQGKTAQQEVADMKIELAMIKVKVAVIASFASIIVSPIVAAIVIFLSRSH